MTITLNFESIPAELKVLPNWISWKHELRDGKPTKTPYQVDGHSYGKVDDSMTWTSFEAVSKASDKIGFVFSRELGFTFVDCDRCIDNSGAINPEALSVVRRLNSYTEISQSRHGLHIIVKALLPVDGRRKEPFELYCHKRYAVMTGNHLLGTPLTIEPRQNEINEIYSELFPPELQRGNGHKEPSSLADTELIAKAMNAANGDKFRRLWSGDTSEYGGDDSAADLALCNHLAFWTGNDPLKIDTLFRQSGLYRAKWERTDYRERTIRKAIENTTETFNGGTLESDSRRSRPEPLIELITTGRHLRDVVCDSLDALYKANEPPHIFRKSGALVRVGTDEKGRPFTEILSESALRGKLARAANFVRIGKEGAKIAVTPPLDVTRDIESLGVWNFPPLIGITEAPVIRPNGTVLNRPGYDATTNLYYYPSSKLIVPLIPDKPRDSDLKAAIELALEPVCDFPFDCEASRANAIATMFTPILRPMVDGPVPLALFDKPQQGTGASLLAEVISLIATGRAAAMMTAQRDDEGWRKAITSLLLKGQLIVTIDNIEFDLWTPSLAAILTATSYQDRILGRSEMVILPNRTTWVATGNNIRLRGDLPRRCIWVRMDAKTARPWQRDLKGFKHPRLIEWVSTERGGILAAILTIVRAWVIAGMPEAKGLPNLGGYESYCRIAGGVLAYMGVSGFLANLDAMYNETDTETPQWEGFFETWREVLGDRTLTAAELISHLNDNAELRAALPDTIADTSTRNYIRRLGNALAKKKGVRFPNGFSVIKSGEYRRAATWQVVSPQKADSHQISLKRCESGPDELPDCPACGRNEWTYSPDGELLCPCVYKGGGR